MQTKTVLPVAVLGLTLFAAACAPNAGPDAGRYDRGENAARPGVTAYDRDGAIDGRYPWDAGRFGLPRLGARDANPYDNALNGARDLNPNLRAGRLNQTTLNEDADRMANVAANVSGVDDATVVIVGKVAYVGLDIDEQVRVRRAPAIERAVARAVKRAYPTYEIRVTSDKGMFQRIGAVNRGIRNGDGYDRYTRDIEFFDRNITR